jgi:hypothetical protein
LVWALVGVWRESELGVGMRGGGSGGLRCGRLDWVGEPLEGEADVYQRAQGLGAGFVLGVVEEVALAALVGGVPVYDVEVGVCGQGCCIGGDSGVGVVEQAVHVAWEALGWWWTRWI